MAECILTLVLTALFASPTFVSSVALYQQCGGEGFRGATTCDWPLSCFRRSRWFSSCQTSCPGADWECGAATGYASGAGSGLAQAWAQCGGDGWNGPRACAQYPCQWRSQWYAQCRPDCPAGWNCQGGSSWSTAPVNPTAAPTVYTTVGSTSLSSVGPTASPTGGSGTFAPSVPSEGSSSASATASPFVSDESTFASTSSFPIVEPLSTSIEPDVTAGEEEGISVDDNDVSDLETYDPSDEPEEGYESDDFGDPSEVDLDALQQQEQGYQEEERRRRRRQNTVRATSCTAENLHGACIATSSCSGKSVAGKCPGAANIQCCIPKGSSCEANGKSGVCISTSSCSGTSVPGKCPGAASIQCCVSGGGGGASCGGYASAAVSAIKGNANVVYSVVKIKKEHLVTPSSASLSATQADNTMTTSTACAFDKMATAAKSAGVSILIASGFRTIVRQEYFWNCYQTKSCNGGNLAARPGTSNHGIGIALDLNTDCGKQTGAKPNCGSSKVYQWLYNNAHNYGFTRTVQSEPWHWEFRGVGVARAPYS